MGTEVSASAAPPTSGVRTETLDTRNWEEQKRLQRSPVSTSPGEVGRVHAKDKGRRRTMDKTRRGQGQEQHEDGHGGGRRSVSSENTATGSETCSPNTSECSPTLRKLPILLFYTWRQSRPNPTDHWTVAGVNAILVGILFDKQGGHR